MRTVIRDLKELEQEGRIRRDGTKKWRKNCVTVRWRVTGHRLRHVPGKRVCHTTPFRPQFRNQKFFSRMFLYRNILPQNCPRARSGTKLGHRWENFYDDNPNSLVAALQERRQRRNSREWCAHFASTWRVLEDFFGPVTSAERGRRNRAVAELREARATPEEIRTAIEFCDRNFTRFTEMAVCAWLSRSLQEQERALRVRALLARLRP